MKKTNAAIEAIKQYIATIEEQEWEMEVEVYENDEYIKTIYVDEKFDFDYYYEDDFYIDEDGNVTIRYYEPEYPEDNDWINFLIDIKVGK